MSEAHPFPPRPPVGDLRDRTVVFVTRVRVAFADRRMRAIALVVVAAVVGFIWFRIGRAQTLPGPLPQAGAPRRSAGRSPASSSSTRPPLFVHVAGAVAHPGLVEVPRGARVADAIAAAGGGIADADLDQLNLAARVADGLRIPVPRRGQVLNGTDAGGGLAGSGLAAASGSAGGLPGAKIPLNTATIEQLDTLPGIGPTLAGAIVRERERRGGFTRVDQLRDVRGIGDVRFADLRDLVTV